MAQIKQLDWGKVDSREPMLLMLPIGPDGEQRSVPINATRMEERFLNAVLRFAPLDLLSKAAGYAESERG